MRHVTRAAGVLAVLVFASACGSGDPGEAAINDMVQAMNEVSDILDTVKDEASAKAAVAKLTALQTKMNDLKKRVEGLGAEKMQELQKKHADKMMAAAMRMMGAVSKLKSVPGAEAAIGDVMKSMQ